MAIRKQAPQVGRWADYDQRWGGYDTLLARVVECWIQDARGIVSDGLRKQRRELVQREALAALRSVHSQSLAIVLVISSATGVSPQKIIEGLRERVEG